MLENLQAPIKAIVGAWSHGFPHDPYPQPGMEWRHEAVRWFDYWLKGRDTGISGEPAFAVYVRDWHPPGPRLDRAPGRWRFEDGWPIERAIERVLHARANHTLSERPGEEVLHSLRYVPSIGIEAGGPVMWWGDVAHDQRPTDAFSLVYDSEPLEEPLEILGLPRALLRVSTDATRANWFVRLSDVAPDGTVTQVAGAGFNGTHLESAKQPRDLEPGEVFDLDVEMHFTSWVFPPGHRIRFAVNNSQWPMMWPTPYAMTTTLDIGGEKGARLVLPTIPFEQRPVPSFLPPDVVPPEGAAELAGFESLDEGTASGYGEISSIDRNPQTGTVTVTATNTGGSRYPWGEERYRETIVHETSDAHPEQTSMRGEHSMAVELEGRSLSWEATLSFRSDEENFYYTYTRRLTENGTLVREKSWNETLPRDYQ